MTTLVLDLVERVKDKYSANVVSFEDYGSLADEHDFLEFFYHNVDLYLRSNSIEVYSG